MALAGERWPALTAAAAAPTPTAQVITVVVEPTSARHAASSIPTLAATADHAPRPPPSRCPTATSGAAVHHPETGELPQRPGHRLQPAAARLEAGARVIPQGYNPTGVPDGAWVQVLEPASNQLGWVSADSEFITCNDRRDQPAFRGGRSRRRPRRGRG